jgi:hypothetical protein
MSVDTRSTDGATGEPTRDREVELAIRIGVWVMRGLSLLSLLLGTYLLPPGHRLVLPALIIPLLPHLVAGALRTNPQLPLPPFLAPAAVYLGLGLFLGVTSNLDKAADKIHGFPTVDVPYRPEYLVALSALTVALAYALLARRMLQSGWPLPRTALTAVLSLVLAAATVAVALLI